MIWVSCEGENPADIENLGPVNYIPKRGFPGYYFPFMNQRGYQPPVLAINFERPKSEFSPLLCHNRRNVINTPSHFSLPAGVLINIECKAWARNIAHDRADRRGSVHFELMVD
jgi:sodium/potassium-transporting ATPase subunit beta